MAIAVEWEIAFTAADAIPLQFRSCRVAPSSSSSRPEIHSIILPSFMASERL